MTEIDSLVSVFHASAQEVVPEMAICSTSLINWEGTQSIQVDVPAKPIAESLWANKIALKKTARESGFRGFILIMCEGSHCCAPITINDSLR